MARERRARQQPLWQKSEGGTKRREASDVIAAWTDGCEAKSPARHGRAASATDEKQNSRTKKHLGSRLGPSRPDSIDPTRRKGEHSLSVWRVTAFFFIRGVRTSQILGFSSMSLVWCVAAYSLQPSWSLAATSAHQAVGHNGGPPGAQRLKRFLLCVARYRGLLSSPDLQLENLGSAALD